MTKRRVRGLSSDDMPMRGMPMMKRVKGDDANVKPTGNTGVKTLKTKKFKAKKKARGK